MPQYILPVAVNRALRLKDVLDRVGLSRTHLYRLIGRQEFPAPVRLSPRVSIWHQADIDAWIDAKFHASGNENA